jgi:DNA-binding transcriptional LysR family regulator
MKVELRRSLSSQIPDELLRGSLEMGAISYDPGDGRLKLVDIYTDSLVFIVSPEHRFAKRKKVNIEELGDEVFIAHNVLSPYRRSVVETFQRHHVPLNIEIELPTIDTIRLLVRQNLGVAFLPRMCVENELAARELRMIPVEEMHMERKVRLVYPAQRQLSHAAQAFLELMGETGDQSNERK